MVDTDRITGAAKEFGGKVQGAVGDLTGSKRDSVEGRAREAQGAAENLYGQAKDTVRDAAETVADTARDIGGRVRDAVGNLVGSDDVEDRARRAQGAAEDAYDRGERYVRSAGGKAYDAPRTPTRTAAAPCARAAAQATGRSPSTPSPRCWWPASSATASACSSTAATDRATEPTAPRSGGHRPSTPDQPLERPNSRTTDDPEYRT